MKKITVLIPAYNEALNIPAITEALESLISHSVTLTVENNNGRNTTSVNLSSFQWEYLFVNDGSTDCTLDVLRNLRKENQRVNILNLSRNFGKENAMLAGMDYASGDAVIIMDADLQDPIEAIPEMIYWWEQGYDDVYGKRINRGRESWLRRRLSLAYYSMLQGTTSIEILENVGDFRLLDRRVVNAICSLREVNRYTKGLFCWVGYNKKEVSFDRAERKNGKSKFNIRRLFNLAIDGVTSYTTKPLRISAIIGFIVSALSLGYMVFTFFKTIVWGEVVTGYPTLICSILFLSGIQLIALGIIGEYIGRIFTESKHRPPYIVESFNEDKK